MASNLKEEIRDQIDGQNEENKELIIEKESQKFLEIFDRVFSENEAEPDDANDANDAVDGIVEDILIAIIKKIKALIKQKFVNEVILNEDGEDESSSETET